MEGVVYYYDWEIELMKAIQSHLGTAGKALASFFTMFGEEMVLIAILGLLYWCLDKKAARFIGTNMMVGLIANPMLKNVVLRRRPYFDNPDIECLKPVDSSADIYDISAQGYSFPSGHSTNAVMLYGSISVMWKKRILRVIAIVLPILVVLSRIALGVHYPTDVLVGWLMGLCVVIIVSRLQRRVKNEHLLHLILFILALSGIIWCRTADYFTALGIMAGFFLAVIFEEKYVNFEETRNPVLCVLRILGGFAAYFGLNTLLKMPFSSEFLDSELMVAFLVRSGRYAIVMFVMLAVYPMLFGRIPILKQLSEKQKKPGISEAR